MARVDALSCVDSRAPRSSRLPGCRPLAQKLAFSFPKTSLNSAVRGVHVRDSLAQEGCRFETAPFSELTSEEWLLYATALFLGSDAACFASPFPRKLTSSGFTSSACVQVMQCGPSFTTTKRAPLT